MIPRPAPSPDAELLCVVLFDIDGTLVRGPERGPSAGLLAMNGAAALLTGVDDTGDPREFAGRTDTQIARMLLQIAGEPEPAANRVARLVREYVAFLAKHVREAPYTPLGDPNWAIPVLKRRGARVGLGTGNVRAGADIKLSSAGIRELFDFARGGFGDDAPTREEVLHIGARRCDPSGRLPVIVVGDTPRDVAAARAIGARCVGTPFHLNTAEILRRAGADAVVDAVGRDLVDAIEGLLQEV